jgi:predicted lipoprotein
MPRTDMATPSSDAPPRLRPVAWPWWVGAGLLLALFVIYPPVRLVKRGATASTAGGATPATFSAAAWVEAFWRDRLQPAATRAPELAAFLQTLRDRPSAARSGSGKVLLRGSGRVTAVERNRVLVEVEGALVALVTGPVFGNAVRDGSGLVEVNDVPGLAEYNEVSAVINRLVEERVQPGIRAGARPGVVLRFAGCAEVPEELPASPAPLLSLVPVWVEVTP